MRSVPRVSLAVYALGVLYSTPSVLAASEEKVTPEQPAIAFFWQTWVDGVYEVPQCSGFQVWTTSNSASSRPVVEPLAFTAFPIGFEPERLQLPNRPVGSLFTWNANYPVGTHLTFAMSDSANNSGGAVDQYVITQSSLTNCTPIAQSKAPISFVTSPEDHPCDEIDMRISGGKAPYTISVLAGQSGLYANVTGITDKNVKLGNVVSAGQVFNLLVTDSNGKSSVVSNDMTSSLNLPSCQRPTDLGSGSSTPIGAIVGGVVGGIAAAVILGLIAWWFIRRRNKKRQEEYRQAQLASSEFRTADGRAPLVEPFMLQTEGPAMQNAQQTNHYAEISPASGGSYDKSLDTYPSATSNPYSNEHHQQQYYSQPQGSSSRQYESSNVYNPSYPHNAGYSYDPYETGAVSGSSAGYPSYDPTTAPPSSSRYDTQPSQPSSSSATDDLANPEEFEFRLPDQHGWNSTGSQLPAGARPYR